MDKATRRSLTSKEFSLLRATERKEMEGLDEDALVELHSRVRRARNKYSTLHRRKASAQVREDRARGKAAQKPIRPAAKAEVFEDALARVSRRLGIVAQETADALKAERIAAARGEGASAGGKKSKKDKKGKRDKKAKKAKKGGKDAHGKAKASKKSRRSELQTPSRKKANASTLAKGARRQAKRDAR